MLSLLKYENLSIFITIHFFFLPPTKIYGFAIVFDKIIPYFERKNVS